MNIIAFLLKISVASNIGQAGFHLAAAFVVGFPHGLCLSIVPPHSVAVPILFTVFGLSSQPQTTMVTWGGGGAASGSMLCPLVIHSLSLLFGTCSTRGRK